jgi:GntR family transcriptional repressor for pyruvate dehydrogenase complex
MAGGFTTEYSGNIRSSMLDPLRVQSLKEACVLRLESMILSGELKIGARLPSERELATQLEISRPILHEALVDLATKGLVRIIPRHGVFINDYRRDGSCALLSSLLNYHEGSFDPQFIHSLMELRLNMEVDCARLAAKNHTHEQIADLKMLLEQEALIDRGDVVSLTERDFNFHLSLAIASGNLVYPLIINSFKWVYTRLTGLFFKRYANTTVVDEVFHFHQAVVKAVEGSQPDLAADKMTEMLIHGEKHLKGEF